MVKSFTVTDDGKLVAKTASAVKTEEVSAINLTAWWFNNDSALLVKCPFCGTHVDIKHDIHEDYFEEGYVTDDYDCYVDYDEYPDDYDEDHEEDITVSCSHCGKYLHISCIDYPC